MLKQISHIALAVGNLDRAIEFYHDVLGLKVSDRQIVEEQKAEVCFVEIGGTAKLELIAPTSDDSPIAKSIAKKGPGLHHICFEVDNIEDRLHWLDDHGIKLVNKEPRKGAEGGKIAFLHPTSTLGALVELCEGCH